MERRPSPIDLGWNMDWLDEHLHRPDASFDGGDLDCGNGLLLLIRRHIDPLQPGQLLEILSSESSVEEDLPSWARLTGNDLVSGVRRGQQRSYLVRKGNKSSERQAAQVAPEPFPPHPLSKRSVRPPSPIKPVGDIAPFSVMGVGSWPRPRWMLRTLEEFLQGRLDDEAFHETADDAVRLCIEAQEKAGVDVITDGEQRRDNYASFVGGRLDNCQLIPITDLLPYVEDPEKFEKELRALDVPADTVRHPAVFGPLVRSRPLTVHELQFAQTVTDGPVKVALPGPYLLTRTMWLECVSDRVYKEREQLAQDVVRVLREELDDLLAHGAALVQFDEPVLTEVVFGRPSGSRSFMCGALGERRDPEEELEFAGTLLNEVFAGFPRQRLALHICRGNWSRDEQVALRGDYGPLLPLLKKLTVGTFFLEMCTPRAGEMALLKDLPADCRLGLGVANPKTDQVEDVGEVVARAEQAVALLGPRRVLLNPDCGFATFAANPVAAGQHATEKLAAIVKASQILRQKYKVD